MEWYDSFWMPGSLLITLKRRTLIPFSILILFSLLISSCGASSTTSSGNVTFQVNPSFREFYQTLGGQETLGPAISESFTRDSYECQYTTNVMMCLNPLISDGTRFFLYPLGNQMGFTNVTGQTSLESGSQVVNGITIYDAFLPLYNQLSGEKYVGKPITEARLNYSQKRVEQFFENMGFYSKFSDNDKKVYLLAYGVYACHSDCKYTASVDSAVSINSNPADSQPLLDGLSRMGDTSVIGQPLTQPYIAPDGMEEQVYTNAIVYASPNDLKHAALRPLAKLLNITSGTPGPQKYDSSNGVVFYATDGSNGFHVPLDFDKFIANHGGLDISGNPIMEVYQYDETTFRQCFENYCLDYHSDQPDGQRVQMSPLGTQYAGQIAVSSETTVPETFSITPQTVTLQATVQYQQIPANADQKMDIQIVRNDNQQPITGVTADLTITLPDQSVYSATFPQTGLDGRASMIISAMNNLSNGQILVYQVCLNQNVGEPVCTNGSYLIWGSN
jgi:hypothetical protein